MVRDGPLLGIGENRVLLLITRDNHLDAFLKIFLRNRFPMISDRAQRSFIDDVGKLRAGSAGGHTRDLQVINVSICLDFFCVYLEDIFPSFEIRQFYRNSTVKPSRSRQRGVERFRTVGRRQNDNPVIALEAVHFGQQLIERLLPFIISGKLSVTFLADRVDFIDKHDAWCFFLGLLEEVAHLGRAHTDEHFNKFRAGHGKERNI